MTREIFKMNAENSPCFCWIMWKELKKMIPLYIFEKLVWRIWRNVFFSVENTPAISKKTSMVGTEKMNDGWIFDTGGQHFKIKLAEK